MPKSLSTAEVARYAERGYHFPVPVLSAAEAADCRRRYEAYEAATGGETGRRRGTRQKLHLLLTWMNDLVRHPRILDAVEDLLGPDILVWDSSYFVKEPQDPGFVSWHQDANYWGLDKPEVLTAWVAFTPATLENGCMRVMPGSQAGPALPHVDTFAPANLLSRGQEIAVEVDEARAVDMPLAAGEASLHHVLIAHASPPNRSNDRRIGLAIRYMTPRVRQVAGASDSAMLVRGQDRLGHFEHEPPPAADLHPDAVALHRRVTEARREILYKDAASRPVG